MTAVASATQPVALPVQPPIAEKSLLQKICELVLRILLPLAALFALYVILPITFSAIHLPFLAAGLAFVYVLLFCKAAVAPPTPLEEQDPRGMGNAAANCWVNSLTQQFRADAGLMNWINKAPVGLSERLAPLATVPLNLFFTREELAQFFTQAELAQFPDQKVPLVPLLPRFQLPANFAALTPERRAAYRTAAETRLFNWLYLNPELDLVNTEDFTPFGVHRYPVAEQPDRQRNAISIINQLRQFIQDQQLTPVEQTALKQKIAGFQAGIACFRYDPVFENAAVILSDELPPDVGRLRMHHSFIHTYPHLRNIFLAGQALAQLAPADRFDALRYLAVIHGIEANKRVAGMKFLSTYKDFYVDYDQTRVAGARQVPFSSHLLRQVFSLNSPLGANNFPIISMRAGQQCDPTEAFNFIEQLLPPELKVEIETRRVYNTDNLPPLAGGPIRPERQSSLGELKLDIIGDDPDLQSMLNHHANREAAEGEGFDLNQVRYPLAREETQFVRAPASLWLTLKRFEFKRPWNFFHAILPCCFPEPEQRSMKIDKPVRLQDEVQITTLQDGVVSYKLDSFVVHLGSSANSGHYITYKLQANDAGDEVWFELNDASVRQVSGDELAEARSQAYFPHYSRI